MFPVMYSVQELFNKMLVHYILLISPVQELFNKMHVHYILLISPVHVKTNDLNNSKHTKLRKHF